MIFSVSKLTTDLQLQTAFFKLKSSSSIPDERKTAVLDDIYMKFLEQQHIPCNSESFQLFFEDSIKV